MDRNNRVSSREDDQRKHETEGIVHGAPVEARSEARRQESAADGEPEMAPGRRPETAEVAGDGLSIDDRQRRAEFATWLQPSAFPASGAEATSMARDAGAPGWVVSMLEGLDPDASLDTIGEAWDRASQRA